MFGFNPGPNGVVGPMAAFGPPLAREGGDNEPNRLGLMRNQFAALLDRRAEGGIFGVPPAAPGAPTAPTAPVNIAPSLGLVQFLNERTPDFAQIEVVGIALAKLAYRARELDDPAQMRSLADLIHDPDTKWEEHSFPLISIFERKVLQNWMQSQ